MARLRANLQQLLSNNEVVVDQLAYVKHLLNKNEVVVDQLVCVKKDVDQFPKDEEEGAEVVQMMTEDLTEAEKNITGMPENVIINIAEEKESIAQAEKETVDQAEKQSSDQARNEILDAVANQNANIIMAIIRLVA